MKTFDYEAAWHEVARPAYEALPQDVRDLLAQVAVEAAGLNQLPDLSMPWPDDPQMGERGTPGSTLRVRFDAIPAETLAFAARVIYYVGHWYPTGADLALPGRMAGAYWKFAHYADQSLRARLAAATSADAMRSNGPFQIHEGVIRLCYSSKDMWTWVEVAPATIAGLEYARKLRGRLSVKLAEDCDQVAYLFVESLRTPGGITWPAEWVALMNTDHYMREEQGIRDRKATVEKPQQHADRRAKIVADFATKIRKTTTERHAILWVFDAGLDPYNVIFYSHENDGAGMLCFGWREPVIDSIRDRILAVISECPFAYRIKCAGGKVLEGGIG